VAEEHRVVVDFVEQGAAMRARSEERGEGRSDEQYVVSYCYSV